MSNNNLEQQLKDLQLLQKHLTLMFEKEGLTHKKALLISQKTISSESNIFGLKGLAWIVAKQDLEYFCLYFLASIFVASDNNTSRKLATLHYKLWEELQQMIIEDKWDKEEFILPRGSSKSTTINKALTTYAHLYQLSRYSLVIGKTKTDASDFVEDIKKFMGFEPIKKAFGNLINKKNRTINQQELELDNDSMVRAYGWQTSVRGTTYSAPDGIFRPTLIVCDDILSEDDIKTENAKENAINKFYKEIAKCGDSEVIRNGVKIKMATKFIILGTPLAQDCFINTIRKDPTFRVFRRSVVSFDVDDYFETNENWKQYKRILFNTKLGDERKIMLQDYYLDNIDKMRFNTIWNDKYKCNEIANDYFTKRTAFLQELMCDCENVGEKWFKSMRKISVIEIEKIKFLKTMLCVDPASTVSNRSDYSAFVVGSLADNGFKYVRKGIITKLAFKDYCNEIIRLLKEYKTITHVAIESNTFKGSDVIRVKELIEKEPLLKDRNIEFINKHQTQNKDNRISTTVDYINSGQVIFNEEDEEFNQQIMEFSGQMTSLHDDAPDVVADFFSRIDEIKSTQYIKFDTKFFL